MVIIVWVVYSDRDKIRNFSNFFGHLCASYVSEFQEGFKIWILNKNGILDKEQKKKCLKFRGLWGFILEIYPL